MKYQGISGIIYDVEEKRLAGGGEGNIHAIIGNSKQVVKIFKENKRDGHREEKLRLMIQKKLTELELQQITWPQDIIYDLSGFVGYVMPKLENDSSLTELYSAPKYDLRFRLLAAVNLCVAIDTVHKMGQVCGDLNPQNIFVNLDKNDRENGFKITLVDTDSYHFTANGNTYRCQVGLGEYIAPELQNKMVGGRDLKSVPLPSYTRQTDLFALAVHIFYLLMNGCHPFACAKDKKPEVSNMSQLNGGEHTDSSVLPQPVENIKNGFFPFYEKRQGIVIPIYAPEFASMPDQIKKMFIRTFVDGYSEPSKRVTALEWQQALSSLSGNIKMCTVVTNHYYFDHTSDCPLCKVDRKIESVLGGQTEIPPSQEDMYQDVFWVAKKRRNWKPGIVGGIVFVVIIMLLIISDINHPLIDTTQTSQTNVNNVSTDQLSANVDIKVEKVLSGVLVSATNRNTVWLDNVTVNCSLCTASGTSIDESTLYFSNLKPGATQQQTIKIYSDENLASIEVSQTVVSKTVSYDEEYTYTDQSPSMTVTDQVMTDGDISYTLKNNAGTEVRTLINIYYYDATGKLIDMDDYSTYLEKYETKMDTFSPDYIYDDDFNEIYLYKTYKIEVTASSSTYK